MNSEFNAIDYAQQLAAVGVPQVQADVHARALALGLATCAATKADLAALEEKLTRRMDLFETRIAAWLDASEANMNLQVAEMRGEIEVMRAEAKYDRRVLHLVLALQIALIAKAFFF